MYILLLSIYIPVQDHQAIRLSRACLSVRLFERQDHSSNGIEALWTRTSAGTEPCLTDVCLART